MGEALRRISPHWLAAPDKDQPGGRDEARMMAGDGKKGRCQKIFVRFFGVFWDKIPLNAI